MKNTQTFNKSDYPNQPIDNRFSLLSSSVNDVSDFIDREK